jgi:DinB superfamily
MTAVSEKAAIKPAADEFAEDYGKYIDLVPNGSVVDNLRKQMTQTSDLLAGLTEEQGNHRYEDGKWSIKEVIGHVIDCERICAYRVLRFARNDQTPLPGFDQDGFAANARFNERNLTDIAAEYSHVRQASIDLLEYMDESAWERRGRANEAEISVRALAWAMCGHELHHISAIKSKYLT